MAFTRFTSKDIISRVVTSPWFVRLVELGIIIFCGWGSDFNNDLMYNQIEYSMKYRADLKDPSYISQVKSISAGTNIVIREPTIGEKDHILFLDQKLKYFEGYFTNDEIKLLSDIIQEAQQEFGFVGTMEIFPFIDDIFNNNPQKMSIFYKNYYQSWQEYCNSYYAPAITVDSYRSKLPARKIQLDDKSAITSLYSPDFFYRFLMLRLGEKEVYKILTVKPERLIGIRNGDWKVFLEKYHQCLITASEIAWIANNAQQSGMLSDIKVIDAIIDHIFTLMESNTDFTSIGSLLDTLISILIGKSVISPILKLFQNRINHRLSRFVNQFKHKEFEPFLKKLSILLMDNTAIQPI